MTDPLSSQFRDAYDASKLNVAGVWIRYFALGGEASEMEVDAYLNGAIALPAFQHDMLAHAINERLDEIAPPRAPYSADFMPIDYIAEYLWDGERGERS
ncbi:MAG: Uncharacterized protein JWP55_3115 [Mycobacterium sp.]|jgi:hypothetical protein|nr:Uncharacterized protein [Mycobacterium sp.]